MSGTEEFGNGGYGTGEFDRAGAEAGSGAAARTAPPTGPRVPAAGVPHQGPAASNDVPGGAVAGAPWLAAGSVPYAEAVFGGAGQPEGPGQRAAGAGRRGVPDAQQRPGAGAVGAQVPPPRAQQAQGVGDAGYGGEVYGEGYVNGYGSRAGGMAQVPQQRFDASPFDSGFTQQGRRFEARDQSRPGGYDPAAPGGPQPGQSGFERGGYDPSASSGGFERPGFESGTYEQAGPPPGFDAPTTEFRPGPMFDEPTVRPGAPAPVAGGPQQPGAGAAPGGLNGRSSVFSSRQAPVNGTAPQAAGPGAPGASGTTQRPSMSGPGTWTAAPPSAPQGSASAAQGREPAAAVQQGQQPAQDGPQPTSAGGSGQVPIGQSPSVSGIPRVPSPTAAGARPPVPDEPLPGPPPLPTRPPRAERQAQQAAQAQAQAQAQGRIQGTAPQAAAARETLTPPRRPVAAPQQQQPQPQP
jgi:hypothetical protein